LPNIALPRAIPLFEENPTVDHQTPPATQSPSDRGLRTGGDLAEAPLLQAGVDRVAGEVVNEAPRANFETGIKPQRTEELRREISFLGNLLGETIRESSGEAALAIVEELRRAAWDRRTGGHAAEQRIRQLVAGLDESQLRVAIRAFTVFLDLLNLVEDRCRVAVLDQRARQVYPRPRSESIRAAICRLHEAGVSADAVQQLINRLHIELVFTAHPTEAKRRSVRGKLRAIRQWMKQLDADPPPEVRQRSENKIRAEIAKLWQTDFIRPWRPSVLQEVERGLSIKPVLWDEVPHIAQDLAGALREFYGDAVRSSRPCLTFGSWIGGDRDGHPGVTADVTAETFRWLRREALAFHVRSCDALLDSLSMSGRQVQMSDTLCHVIEESVRRWPVLQEQLAGLPPGELCRRWLAVIRWRLQQTAADPLLSGGSGTAGEAAYPSAGGLASDVALLAAAIGVVRGSRYVLDEVTTWQTQIDTFGFHLARLDVRQNASVYREVLDELFRRNGWHPGYAGLDETGRCRLLEDSLSRRCRLEFDDASPMLIETVALFRSLHRIADAWGIAAIGAHVVSMTSAASDILAVLWLWQQSADRDGNGGERSERDGLRIVPLLETIEDLEHGPSILAELLALPAYRQHLGRLGDDQLIMLGYSDSTKDGGYLMACWSLHRAQHRLVEVARPHGIELTFFHGRGGSLGRGGGPAARSILSLPEGTFSGCLRLTEQGEVLADRYDDRAIAYRHLEQVLGSALLAAGDPPRSDSARWYGTMDRLSRESLRKYRQLIEQPAFLGFFRCATPISEIEQLPIGSRPSRRKPDGGLSDLRAIPWVFSWTQSRTLLPAWYGLGSALRPALDNPALLAELQSMYTLWPFFRALIDNAELALAKSDPDIAAEYASLADGNAAWLAIASLIAAEYDLSCRAVLALTGRGELLDAMPWLKESIRVRNRFIDPLNLIQVELLRRQRQGSLPESRGEELKHLTRLSIKGLAAGMRTSG
jgi:phosphoenolpyruvate carboxylase